MSRSEVLSHLFMPLVSLWFIFYGALLVVLTFFPLICIHLAAISVILAVAVHFKLPQQEYFHEQERLKEILGPDPNLGVKSVKIAHRGAGLDAPENSLLAVKRANIDGNVTCVEFDVSFTKDGVAVIFHDDDVRRTTGSDLGLISDLNFDEVSRLNLALRPSPASWTAHESAVEMPDFVPIPTLQAMVQLCLSLNVSMIIDLKTFAEPHRTSEAIVSLFDAHPELYSRALVSSFYPHLIYAIRRRRPQILCSLAYRPKFASLSTFVPGHPEQDVPRFAAKSRLLQWAAEYVADPVHHLACLHWPLLPALLGASALLVQYDTLSSLRLLRQLRGDRQLRLVAWTVNDAPRRDYCERVLRINHMSDTVYL